VSNTSGDANVLGLTSAEAAKRLAAKQGNRPSKSHGRTVRQIIRANVLTRFNAILSALLIVIVVLGPVQDGLFGIVLVANAFIGIGQEVLAKRTSDRLNLVTTSKGVVSRDGKDVEVATWDVVRGDLVALKSGGQVVVDGPVVVSDGLEVDESLLTGENLGRSKVLLVST
jgi:cation-transporting P-type ATPase E